MVEQFGGIIWFIIYILILIGTAFYCFQVIFTTRKFTEKYGVDQSGAFFIRFSGTFLLAFVIIMLIMLFNGIAGQWVMFAYGLLQAISALVIGYATVELSDFRTNKGEKISKEGYLAPLAFTIAWAVLIYGVSDKIYV